MCENQAKKDGYTLGKKFWRDDEWGKTFKYQLMLAHGLLKLYSGAVLVKVLNMPQLSKVYSLKAPFLDKYLQEEQKKFNIEQTNLQKLSEIQSNKDKNENENNIEDNKLGERRQTQKSKNNSLLGKLS